jgi:hypothetical protein
MPAPAPAPADGASSSGGAQSALEAKNAEAMRRFLDRKKKMEEQRQK